jgi:hypothetical protein
LLTQFDVGIRDRLVIQLAENKLFLVIALFYEHPHPLAQAKLLVCDFDFNVITFFVFTHLKNPLKSVPPFQTNGFPVTFLNCIISNLG